MFKRALERLWKINASFADKYGLEKKLDDAILHGDLDRIKYLVETKGVDPRTRDDHAMMLACVVGRVKVIDYLISRGVDPTDDSHAYVAVAAYNSRFETVDFLVAKGACVDAKNYAALFMTAQSGTPAMIDHLWKIKTPTSDQIARALAEARVADRHDNIEAIEKHAGADLVRHLSTEGIKKPKSPKKN